MFVQILKSKKSDEFLVVCENGVYRGIININDFVDCLIDSKQEPLKIYDDNYYQVDKNLIKQFCK